MQGSIAIGYSTKGYDLRVALVEGISTQNALDQWLKARARVLDMPSITAILWVVNSRYTGNGSGGVAMAVEHTPPEPPPPEYRVASTYYTP